MRKSFIELITYHNTIQQQKNKNTSVHSPIVLRILWLMYLIRHTINFHTKSTRYFHFCEQKCDDCSMYLGSLASVNAQEQNLRTLVPLLGFLFCGTDPKMEWNGRKMPH